MRVSEELRRRTKTFASRVVRLYASLPRQRKEVDVLGLQFIRSGTSVAANLREASRARPSAEFFSKLSIVLQEADESALWLELLAEDYGLATEENHSLHREL